MLSSIETLETAWRDIDVRNRPPFGLADDLAILGHDAVTFATYDEWLEGVGLASLPGPEFHLGLVPVPYIGDLRHASVFVLMLNPGFEPDDYFAESHAPAFRQALIRNLRQEFEPSDYPFVYLDPRFCWHSAGKYWRQRLEWLANEIKDEKNVPYIDRLRDVARRVACLQLVPYHSARFEERKRFSGLKSSKLVYSFLHEELLPAARAGRALLIAARRSKEWGLTEETNVVIYSGSETRAAHLNAKSRGGAEIRAFLRQSAAG